MGSKYKYYQVYKPYGMLCQFSGEPNDITLAHLDFRFPKDVYSVGRLDKDSEGLLLLTNDNRWKTELLDPKKNKSKTYLVQVEGEVLQEQLALLASGKIIIKHNKKAHTCKKTDVKIIDEPSWLPERNPPVRYRKSIPTTWLELTIFEGKNRQVRKMTAQAGCPTLRLIRLKMSDFSLLSNSTPGKVFEIFPNSKNS